MSEKPTTLDVPQGTARPESTASTLRGEDAMIEKKEDGGMTDGGETLDGTLESQEEVDPNEYPSGMKMVFIVIALVLSIFLVALDMVGCHPHPLSSMRPYANESYNRLSLLRPSPRLPTSSRVSTRSAGTVLPFS